ncbi:MAG: PIN domain-containing protein [Nitrospirae bacterium]|nr:MAG: PIN domain-containing protein [Nitrospirota bacterium]
MQKRFRVFLDTSVLIAGLVSSTGSAREVLRLAELGLIELVISEQVLIEADRNINSKLPELINEFRFFIKKLSPLMVDTPEWEVVQEYITMINPYDAPILAAADINGVDFLLTWDRTHFIGKQFDLKTPLRVLTPGEFLEYFRNALSEDIS